MIHRLKTLSVFVFIGCGNQSSSEETVDTAVERTNDQGIYKDVDAVSFAELMKREDAFVFDV